MAAQWQRWLRYAKARLDATVREGEAELDRREAELQARSEGKPWLSSSGDAPTLDEARARIEHQAREAERLRREREGAGEEDPSAPAPAAEGSDQAPATGGPRPAGPGTPPPPLTTDPQLGSFDFAAQQRAAEERLAALRAELGLAPDAEPPAGDGPDEPTPEDEPDEDEGPDAPVAPV